tara:strand:+ start:72 stop:305 length:234 start_codon:yes stop_codon:yes gene_type:complete
MDTTIQVSGELREKLQKLKIYSKETYEDIIWDLIEDRMELSEETKKNISEYEKDVKEGNWNKFSSLNEVKKRLKINV